jgi:hypothetical protein
MVKKVYLDEPNPLVYGTDWFYLWIGTCWLIIGAGLIVWLILYYQPLP